MPSTSWVDFTAEVREIPNRTDSTGTGVDDLPLREDALINAVLTEGVVTPAGAFEPAKGSGDFDVDIGSGTSGADIFVVESDVTGQQPYIVTLEQASATVTLDAADADPRVDEIYLVVRDDGVDSNADGHRLPRLGYRKGDSATSNPSAPGADSGWKNYALLATISVSGGASSISAGDITDERADSSLLQKLFDESVRRTAAAVFGEVLDGRYLNVTGDTATGSVKWTSGWPEIESTDTDSNTWLFRLDFASADTPRLVVFKNGSIHSRFYWDETNTRWILSDDLRVNGSLNISGAIDMNNNLIREVNDPSTAQDAATKNYVDNRSLPSDNDFYNAGAEFIPIIAVEGAGFVRFKSDRLVVGTSGGSSPNARAVVAPMDFDLVDTLEIRWESAVTDSDTVRFGAYQGEMRGAGDAGNARSPDAETTRVGTFGPVNDSLDVSTLSGWGSVFVEADSSFDDTQTTVYRMTKTA